METSEFSAKEFLEEFLANCNHSNYYAAVEELNVSFTGFVSKSDYLATTLRHSSDYFILLLSILPVRHRRVS